MPLFSLSRRKSASNLAQSRSEAQETERGRGTINQHDTGSRGMRSQSATRVGGTRRPERDIPPALPPLPVEYTIEARNSFSPQESFETSRRQSSLPPGAMPPRRQSSMDDYVAQSPPPLPSKHPRRQSSLGAFDASPSRPSNSSHVSSLAHNPQYSYTPPRQSNRRESANPPISNSAKFARSTSSVDYSPAGNDVVGIPPSSSFYAASPRTERVRDGSFQGLSSPFGSPQTSRDHSTGLGMICFSLLKLAKRYANLHIHPQVTNDRCHKPIRPLPSHRTQILRHSRPTFRRPHHPLLPLAPSLRLVCPTLLLRAGSRFTFRPLPLLNVLPLLSTTRLSRRARDLH